MNKNEEKYERPTCLNYGCNNLVTHAGSRWRPFCSRCHVANYDKKTVLKEGVTAFRTGKCKNQNGQLGFKCPMNYRKSPWAVGLTQVDHIDGNYFNNVPENCMELCSACHTEKGRRNGDFRKQRKY